MDAEPEILAIRSRIAAAQRAQARAEHERDAAKAAADAARDRLADEFGVTDTASAHVLLARLEAQRDAALAQLKTELDQAGV